MRIKALEVTSIHHVTTRNWPWFRRCPNNGPLAFQTV